jgi:hypothetical protein
MTGTTQQKDMVITATKIVWGPPKMTPVTYENLVRERDAAIEAGEMTPYKGITFPEDGLKFTLLTWSRP